MYIKIRVMKINTVDHVQLIIQKIVVLIRIDLNTNLSNAKTVAALVVQINWNGIYVEMSLRKRLMLVIHPVFCVIILLVDKQ